MMSWRPVAPTAVELMRGPCGAPCAREGLSMNEVWLAGKYSTRSFRREVSEAMRGGDVGSQAEVTETEMEAMPRHDPWELLKASLRHLALLSCV